MRNLPRDAEKGLEEQLNMPPSSASADLSNGSGLDSILGSESLCRGIAGTDGPDLTLHEQVHPVILSLKSTGVEAPHADAVFDVSLSCDPFEIFDSVISPDGVDVVHFRTDWWRAKKGFCDKSMNKTGSNVGVEVNGQIPITRPQVWFQYSSDFRSPCGGVSFDLAVAGDGIFRESDNWEPLGLLHG